MCRWACQWASPTFPGPRWHGNLGTLLLTPWLAVNIELRATWDMGPGPSPGIQCVGGALASCAWSQPLPYPQSTAARETTALCPTKAADALRASASNEPTVTLPGGHTVHEVSFQVTIHREPT